MSRSRYFTIGVLVSLLLSAPIIAQANAFENQIKARQGQMQIIALNLSVLAGMARGTQAYDAQKAQDSANNLVALSNLTTDVLWPEGSMTGSASKDSIWSDNIDFLQKWDAMGPAAEALADVASTDAAAIGAALGALGATCSACHKAHRARR